MTTTHPVRTANMVVPIMKVISKGALLSHPASAGLERLAEMDIRSPPVRRVIGACGYLAGASPLAPD
jgi:hypothetical protein